ncbi:MAG TPA: caspase family protein, partial [Thermotogota bacterium]|nr:caspase family protein [Thermotogota bacterium]
MMRNRSRWLVVFVFLFLPFLFIGCFFSEPEAFSLQIRVQDEEGLAIPGAFVEIRNGEDALVSTGKTSEDGVFPFKSQPGKIRILAQSTFLTFQGELLLTRDAKTKAISLHDQKNPGASGITWRAREGKPVPFLFLPPQAKVVQIVSLPCKQLPANSPATGTLFAPPLLQTTGKNHLLWFDTSYRTSASLLDVSSLWDFPNQAFNPLLDVQVLDKEGNEIGNRGGTVLSHVSSSRPIFPDSELTRVGDISSLPGTTSGSDGAIDVWDLVFLLNHYGTTTSSGDIAQMLSQVTAPPNGPFCHNLDSFGPDGTVDVWDLILLLNMYGHTLETINTPFAPQITQVTSLGANQFRVDWQIPFENDCQETFVLYTLDATPGFDPNPIVNVPVGAVPATARSYTITSTKPYVAICAYNVLDVAHYYSQPDFATLGSGSPLPPSAPTLQSPYNGASQVPVTTQLSWQPPSSGSTPFSYNVYLGTTSSPPKVANGLSTPSYTASLSQNTTYYWKVEASNSYGSAFSSTWHFSTTQPETKEWRALLVGINDYAGYDNDLRYCVNDANDLETVLENTNEDYHVQKLLDNVPGANLQIALQAYQQQATSEDVFVFSFSGHGFYDGQSYIVFSDETTWSVSSLRSFLDNIEGTKVVFIDACMSGGFTNLTSLRGQSVSPAPFTRDTQSLFLQDLMDTFSSRGYESDSEYYVMAACSTSESAYENSSIANGYFTFSVADGLGHVGQSNPGGSFNGSYDADTNSDTQVSFREMADFTTAQVLSLTGSDQHVQSSPSQTSWVFATYAGNPPPPVEEDDQYEEDDTSGQAKNLPVGQLQSRVLADQDWVYFDATAGDVLEVESSQLSSGCNTVFTLYNSSLQQVAYDNDGAGGFASRISYTPASSGRLYLKIAQYGGSSSRGYSFDNTYNLLLQTSQLPSAPTNPTPANGQTSVSVDADLNWDDCTGSGNITYDVYFGTSSNPPRFATGLTSSSYSLPTLNSQTQYFWKIVAIGAAGSTTGPVWSFTTAFSKPPEGDDDYEEDDSMQTAKPIFFGETQDHILADEDWVYFYASSAKQVILETLNLQNCDTYLKLFDSWGSLLAQDDDSGEGYASKITYSLPSDGYYYLRVSDYANRGKTPPKPAGEGSGSPRYSSDSSYQVRLQEGTPDPDGAVVFKIANSWGEGSWENVPDGFLYMTAETMIQNQIDSFFYVPRENYQPQAVAVFQINHSVRNDCVIELGVGNPSSPRMVKKVYGDRDYGGPYYYAGG